MQGTSVLTRKPENVRMGKGKGGKVGIQVRVYPGQSLVALSSIRPGALRALYRRLRVRCRFVLGLQHALVQPVALGEGLQLF